MDALLATRSLCQEQGVRALVQQRVTTVVSELCRNIVAYTPGGYLELELKQGPMRLQLRAVDRGTGIGNLPEILAGRYRSKTGLGRGILGTKQLAHQFNIATGPSGTTIDAELLL
ncbi:MAG: histidine kinase [Polyangiaceae bacterium]|nr:histidine kinase [Polyangiaceae bacterium]